MKKELADKLYVDFPELYAQRGLDDTRSLMCYGFACGDGWYRLITDLSRRLTDLAREKELFVEACQVKEKFGTLCFYVDISPNPLHWTTVERGWVNVLARWADQLPSKLWVRGRPSYKVARHFWRLSSWIARHSTVRVHGSGKRYSQDAWHTYIQDVRDAISFYEDVSRKICEDCGMYGTRRGHGSWIHYVCQTCYDREQAEETKAGAAK